MRDFSHGPVRKEAVKDYGSFRMRVSFKLQSLYGIDADGFGFTESDIRKVMHLDSESAARTLYQGTDNAEENERQAAFEMALLHGPAAAQRETVKRRN